MMGKGFVTQDILDSHETDQAAFLAYKYDSGAIRQLQRQFDE